MSTQQGVPLAAEQDGLPKSVPSMDVVIADVVTSLNPSRGPKATPVVTIKGIDINTGNRVDVDVTAGVHDHSFATFLPPDLEVPKDIPYITHLDPLTSPILMSQARLQGKTLISG